MIKSGAERRFSGGIVYVVLFFALTPVALLTSVFALIAVSQPRVNSEVLGASIEEHNLIAAPQTGVKVYASLPGSLPSANAAPVVEDARAEIIRQYLHKYHSPLEPMANYIVEIADKYGVDFRLTTAIAQQESNLCKKIPAESYNCWGWGIHSKGTLAFSSYRESIEAVTRGIRKEYIDKGYANVDEIMEKWIPHSPEGAWAKGVTGFMEELE